MQNLGLRVQAVDPNKLGQSQYYRIKAKIDNLRKKMRKLDRDMEERVYMGREQIYRKKQAALQKEADDLNRIANKLGI